MSVHLSTKYEMKVFSRHLNAERFCIVSFSENMNIIDVCVMTMSSFWLILSFFSHVYERCGVFNFCHVQNVFSKCSSLFVRNFLSLYPNLSNTDSLEQPPTRPTIPKRLYLTINKKLNVKEEQVGNRSDIFVWRGCYRCLRLDIPRKLVPSQLATSTIFPWTLRADKDEIHS